MLRGPGFSHELSERKTSCPDDKTSIGGPSLGRLLPVILDRSGASENTDIFTFLRSSLNLFADKDEGCHGFDGASQ
jgi:hypothetical protein